MVRKRDDGRWEGRIVVGHKENSDPIFQYVLAPTQKALLEKLHQNIETFRDVDLCEDSRMTLAQWLERWLSDYAAPRLRESTMGSYRIYAEQYIIPRLGGKKMMSITAADIQRLYTKLREEGRMREHPEHGRQLSASTVRRIHTMLHRAMADAVRAHIIPRNPAEGAALPKADRTAKRVLTDKELDDFMEAIKADPLWYDFFYTELTTGLRRGEICGLMWSDFDERRGTLKISRTLHREKSGRLVAGDTKTYAGTRKIVLPRSTVQLLCERKKNSFSPWVFHDPLRPEHPIPPETVYRRLKALLKQAGLPDIPFHGLRHTFVSTALENGMDVKTLSTMIGHVSAETTLNIYSHITDEMRQMAAAKIDRGIGKCKPQGESASDSKKTHGTHDFDPYKGSRRKAGTGCVTQINEHLWEGKYSPKWPDGKKHSRSIYAPTEAECEEKLAGLIQQMKMEIVEAKRLAAAGRWEEVMALANQKKARGVRTNEYDTPKPLEEKTTTHES